MSETLDEEGVLGALQELRSAHESEADRIQGSITMLDRKISEAQVDRDEARDRLRREMQAIEGLNYAIDRLSPVTGEED